MFVCGPGKVTLLVRGFNSDWKKAIELINQDVMRSFTNFKNGTQIMQVEEYWSSTASAYIVTTAATDIC